MVLRPEGFDDMFDLILPSDVIVTTVDETSAERTIDSSCVSVLNFENVITTEIGTQLELSICEIRNPSVNKFSLLK